MNDRPVVTLELSPDEVVPIAHARGDRHNGAECRWCKSDAWWSAREREARDRIDGMLGIR